MIEKQPPKRTPKPGWLKRKLPTGPAYEKVRTLLKRSNLNTVCQEAKCPNVWECFSRNTSAFLLMGPNCTRNCGYCSVVRGNPKALDPEEPNAVAAAAEILGLTYVVVTSVTRDDLPDGGAGRFAQTIREIRRRISDAKVEVLIPDFQGDACALATVVSAKPDVLNHNVETVPRLYRTVRPKADYRRSLDLLRRAGQIDPGLPTKSGIMLGLGETPEEIEAVLGDLLNADCKMLTLGQYLQPTENSLPVERFATPKEFEMWKEKALRMGFAQAACGPFVRSSYHAEEFFRTNAQTRSNTP